MSGRPRSHNAFMLINLDHSRHSGGILSNSKPQSPDGPTLSAEDAEDAETTAEFNTLHVPCVLSVLCG